MVGVIGVIVVVVEVEVEVEVEVKVEDIDAGGVMDVGRMVEEDDELLFCPIAMIGVGVVDVIVDVIATAEEGVVEVVEVVEVAGGAITGFVDEAIEEGVERCIAVVPGVNILNRFFVVR